MAFFTSIIAAVITIAKIALPMILSAVAQSLTKKPKSDTAALDFEQTVQRRLSNGQPLEVLVGRRIVSGAGFFDDSYSTKREKGVSVTVMSAKPCTSFHKFYLDGEPVTLSGDPTTGEVNVTSHFLGKNDAPRVKVRIFLGDDNSALGVYLNGKFPSKYTSSDNHGDYCVIIVECRNTNDDFDEDEGKSYIPFQGYPEYKAEMSGVKICDPRIVDADYADESTYVYSDNSALIDAQYDYGWFSGVGSGRALIVGNGYPVDLMDLDQIESAADYCDTEDFTCAGLLRSGDSGDQDEIWKTYNADRVEHAAKVYSVPEGNRETSETIDLSDYPAAFIMSYDKDGYSTEVYNEVKTVYAEPEEFYGEKDLPIYSDASWIAADNHIPRQMPLPLLFVTDKVQAGKLEKQEIYISRAPATCTISDLPFGFIRIKVGTIVTITNSDVDAVNDKEWIVKGRGQSMRGDVTLTLRELADSEAFAFDELTETPEPEIQIPDPRPWSDWQIPSDFASPRLLNGIRDGTQTLANIRIVGHGDYISETTVQNANINTALSGGSGGLGITISPNNAVGSDDGTATVSITTNSVTATVSGGTAPYSWVITKVSGDTIPPDTDPVPDGASATSTFTDASVLTGAYRSAIYKFTVTDDASATISINCNVSVSNYDETGIG